MALLGLGLRQVELASLAVVIGEGLRANPQLLPLNLLGKGTEAVLRILARAANLAAPGVWLVICAARGIVKRHVAVLLEMVERTSGRIDRQMSEVRTAKPLQLGVEVREIPSLQQRIVAEVDARNDIAGVERHLLGLGEEIVDAAVQHEPPDDSNRDLLLGNDLGRVEHIEVEGIGEIIVEELKPELPLRIIAQLDRVPEIAAMEVRIGAVQLHRLVPDHRLQALLRLPMELDEGRLAGGVDEAEGVDAEAFHEAE